MTNPTTGPPTADLAGACALLSDALQALQVWRTGEAGDRVRAGHAAYESLDALRYELHRVMADLGGELHRDRVEREARVDEYLARRPGRGDWVVEREDPTVDTTPDPANVETWPLNGRTSNGVGGPR